MKTIANLGFLLLVLSLGAGTADAANDYEKLKNRLKRFGVTEQEAFDGKTKSLCVCQEGQANAKDNTVGVIVWSTTLIDNRSYLRAQCRPIGHGIISGSRDFLIFCDDWVPLAK